MNALIFAAGLGTRLRPLTDSCPKALVEVGGEPMLGRVIRRVVAAGVDRIVVNVHHFPDMVADYLRRENDFGVDIRVSDERDCLLDTGGGLLKALPLFDDDEPILLHNADILTDSPLRAQIEAHRESGACATLLADARDSSRRLLFDDSMRMRGWARADFSEVRPAGLDVAGLEPLAFGGVHVVSRSVEPLLARYASVRGRVFSITDFYVEMCGHEVIRGFRPSESYRWYDIGRPASLAEARGAVAAGLL